MRRARFSALRRKLNSAPIPLVAVSCFDGQSKDSCAYSRAWGKLMRRRDFIKVIGGAAAAYPISARGQQRQRVRQIGVLLGSPTEESSDSKGYVPVFLQELQKLGWTDGQNARIQIRWGAGNPDIIRMLQSTRSVPIVFANVADPVGAGFVDSLARPGGNATGFIQFEYSLSGKWLELLKEIAPSVTRAAVLRDPAITSGIGQFAVIQSVAPSVGVEVSAINVRDAGEIERAISAFKRSSNDGLIVTASALAVHHSELIIGLAARYKLPAIYYRRFFVTSGGLACYGYDIVEQFRSAAGYVDRILKGEKPAELPVQAPTKYELVLNLKTAKALGIDVPPTLLARADAVIE
jgi:putative ABC transport system substrate-binding protein